MLFAGGPATGGPGVVVSNELKELICLHHNIEHNSIKHYKYVIKIHVLTSTDVSCGSVWFLVL